MQNQFDLQLARFEEYMQSAGWSDRTVGDYGALVRHFIAWLRDETDVRALTDIDSQTLHSYQNYLYHTKSKHGKRLSLATQYNKLVAVRSFFSYLQTMDVVLFNVKTTAMLNRTMIVERTDTIFVFTRIFLKRLMSIIPFS